MQLSIIIPVYKVEEYIGKCLQSIVDGGRKCPGEFEVIVVDDGSPDSSGDIADSFAKKHSFIKVIHKNNEGVAAARIKSTITVMCRIQLQIAIRQTVLRRIVKCGDILDSISRKGKKSGLWMNIKFFYRVFTAES